MLKKFLNKTAINYIFKILIIFFNITAVFSMYLILDSNCKLIISNLLLTIIIIILIISSLIFTYFFLLNIKDRDLVNINIKLNFLIFISFLLLIFFGYFIFELFNTFDNSNFYQSKLLNIQLIKVNWSDAELIKVYHHYDVEFKLNFKTDQIYTLIRESVTPENLKLQMKIIAEQIALEKKKSIVGAEVSDLEICLNLAKAIGSMIGMSIILMVGGYYAFSLGQYLTSAATTNIAPIRLPSTFEEVYEERMRAICRIFVDNSEILDREVIINNALRASEHHQDRIYTTAVNVQYSMLADYFAALNNINP